MPPIQRVVLRETTHGQAAGRRAPVHRPFPRTPPRHPSRRLRSTSGPKTSSGRCARLIRSANSRSRSASGATAMAHRPDHRRTQSRLFPIIKRYGQIHRPRRRLQSHGVGAHERRRHILGTLGFVRPLHPRQRQQVFIGVGQIRFAQDHLPGLLTGRDDERGIAPIRRHQAAHRVAGAGAGVQVHQRGFAGGLREPVGHGQHRRLLQPQDIGEIVGEVLQRTFARWSQGYRTPSSSPTHEAGRRSLRGPFSCLP